MPRPKDFTPAMERKRKKLAEKLEKKKGIKKPWGLATYLVRKKAKGRKKR